MFHFGVFSPFLSFKVENVSSSTTAEIMGKSLSSSLGKFMGKHLKTETKQANQFEGRMK